MSSNLSASCKRRRATSSHASCRKRAVRLFEVTAHLHERFFLAAKIHRERAAQFLVLLAKLGLLGFQRNVFGPEQFDVVFHVAVENFIAPERELTRVASVRRSDARAPISAIPRSGWAT